MDKNNVIFSLEDYIRGLSNVNVKPTSYVLNSNIYSQEKIFNKNMDMGDYKKIEAMCNECIGNIYDIIVTELKRFEMTFKNKVKAMGKDSSLTKNLVVICDKAKVVKEVQNIIFGKSQVKKVPVGIINNLKELRQELQGNYFEEVLNRTGYSSTSIQMKLVDAMIGMYSTKRDVENKTPIWQAINEIPILDWLSKRRYGAKVSEKREQASRLFNIKYDHKSEKHPILRHFVNAAYLSDSFYEFYIEPKVRARK